MTCFERSMTRRARRIGFFTCVTLATAPAWSVRPSMMAASSSFVPVFVNTAPRPALKSGESSSTTIAAATASRLVPPPASTSRPARSASVIVARYASSCSAVMSRLRIVPTPPCTARRKRGPSVDIIRRDRLPLEVLVEPVEDVLQPLDAMHRLARARELVRFPRKEHHHRRLVLRLERTEHRLRPLPRRRAQILLAVDEHERRRDVRGVARGRAIEELLRILERRRAEPARREEREVGRVPEADPIRHRALRYGCRKAMRLRDRPVREQPAAASARHTQVRRIDVPTTHERVDGHHQILVIVARIVVLDDVAE